MSLCMCIDYVDMKTLGNSRSGHKRIKSMTNCKKVNKEKPMANKVGVWVGCRVCLINGCWIWTYSFTMPQVCSKGRKADGRRFYLLTLSFQLNGPTYSCPLLRVGSICISREPVKRNWGTSKVLCGVFILSEIFGLLSLSFE